MQKKNSHIPLIAVLLLAAAVLFMTAGCDFFNLPVTPEQRAEAFVEDLNNEDRSQMRNKHVHPDAQDYSTIGSKPNFWDDAFGKEYGDYTLSGIHTDGDTVTGTLSSASYFEGGFEVIFVMQNDNDSAKIYSLTIHEYYDDGSDNQVFN
ncbi:MAG: hypothetical protein ACOCVC_00050 [Spirochaeta sp.]